MLWYTFATVVQKVRATRLILREGNTFPTELALPNKMKLRRMRLINKFLSPKCAHGLGDVDTYFFLKKKFDLRSECVL